MAVEKKSPKATGQNGESAPKVVPSKVSVPIVDNRNPLERRRTMTGVVVSNKMQKTIVVSVDRRVKDAFYKKFIVRSRKFKAHDERNEAKPGDRVSLIESRPMSREKRWVLQSIIRRAGQVAEVNV